MEESATKRRRTLNGSDQIVAVPVIQKETTVENNSSPNRKISPSKGSRDLNSILRRKTTETGSPNKENFVKPYPPTNKLRQSSLKWLVSYTHHHLHNINNNNNRNLLILLVYTRNALFLNCKRSLPILH